MKIRTIATPLTIGAFILVSVTGLCMFFEIKVGFIKPAHEWLSLAFLVGALLHIVVHWKAIRNHLHTRIGKSLAILFATLTIIAVIPSGFSKGEESERESAGKAVTMLLDANLSQIAMLTHRSGTEVASMLVAQGLTKVDTNQSVLAVALMNKRKPRAVLALLLQNVKSQDEDN